MRMRACLLVSIVRLTAPHASLQRPNAVDGVLLPLLGWRCVEQAGGVDGVEPFSDPLPVRTGAVGDVRLELRTGEGEERSRRTGQMCVSQAGEGCRRRCVGPCVRRCVRRGAESGGAWRGACACGGARTVKPVRSGIGKSMTEVCTHWPAVWRRRARSGGERKGHVRALLQRAGGHSGTRRATGLGPPRALAPMKQHASPAQHTRTQGLHRAYTRAGPALACAVGTTPMQFPCPSPADAPLSLTLPYFLSPLPL